MSIDQLRAELESQDSITFTLRIHPGAKKTQFNSVMADGTIKIDVAAPPEEGRANAALVEFLAEEFGVAKGNVEIVVGETGRRKVVKIRI